MQKYYIILELCKQTYQLREWLLLRYNFLTTNLYLHLYIPPFKNPYPFLLMHYYENKLPRKGRNGYKHYIMEFLCNQKRNTTTIPLTSSWYHNIGEFAENQGLICIYNKWYNITIHKI